MSLLQQFIFFTGLIHVHARIKTKLLADWLVSCSGQNRRVSNGENHPVWCVRSFHYWGPLNTGVCFSGVLDKGNETAEEWAFLILDGSLRPARFRPRSTCDNRTRAGVPINRARREINKRIRNCLRQQPPAAGVLFVFVSLLHRPRGRFPYGSHVGGKNLKPPDKFASWNNHDKNH